jgi:hypothetical protein
MIYGRNAKCSRRAFSATVLLLGLGVASGPPRSAAAEAGHDFQICKGRYALCAASTCKPTGKFISVNVIAGGTASFPEYDCTCPILDGPAIGDLNGGNMQGSCEPPPDQIWSLFAPRASIPQAINNWVRFGPGASAPPQICPASLNLGDQLVNCFSFACDYASPINGVPVATCHCPLGESLEGTSVPADTAFATQAGQGDQAFCSQFPVSGPLPAPGSPLP